MKKLLSILVALLILNTVCMSGSSFITGKFLLPVYAQDDDLWGNFNTDLSSPKESRFVSDEEFEQAIKTHLLSLLFLNFLHLLLQLFHLALTYIFPFYFYLILYAMI